MKEHPINGDRAPEAIKIYPCFCFVSIFSVPGITAIRMRRFGGGWQALGASRRRQSPRRRSGRRADAAPPAGIRRILAWLPDRPGDPLACSGPLTKRFARWNREPRKGLTLFSHAVTTSATPDAVADPARMRASRAVFPA